MGWRLRMHAQVAFGISGPVLRMPFASSTASMKGRAAVRLSPDTAILKPDKPDKACDSDWTSLWKLLGAALMDATNNEPKARIAICIARSMNTRMFLFVR